jgi:hypothetical protein
VSRSTGVAVGSHAQARSGRPSRGWFVGLFCIMQQLSELRLIVLCTTFEYSKFVPPKSWTAKCF